MKPLRSKVGLRPSGGSAPAFLRPLSWDPLRRAWEDKMGGWESMSLLFSQQGSCNRTGLGIVERISLMRVPRPVVLTPNFRQSEGVQAITQTLACVTQSPGVQGMMDSLQ